MSLTSGSRARGDTDSDAADGGPEGLHVAIIMDGNGRWAKARGMPRVFGHKAGVAALKRTVEAAPEFGVTCLTVFGFSTENWSRPAQEVAELMSLPQLYFESDLPRLHREGVRVRVLGRRDGLSDDLRAMIEEAETMTAGNTRFNLQVAFNYGGRADIVDAARQLATSTAYGLIDPLSIDAAAFEARLSTANLAAPDLIVRTSGERRLSNFLLWEAAYAELVFQDVLWPDYGATHLKAALDEFARRERRYGGADVKNILATG